MQVTCAEPRVLLHGVRETMPSYKSCAYVKFFHDQSAGGPLSIPTRWKSPELRGVTRCVATDPDPADCPNSITLPAHGGEAYDQDEAGKIAMSK